VFASRIAFLRYKTTYRVMPPFDSFRFDQDDRPIWLQSALTLDRAKACVQVLGQAEYIKESGQE
jgi:hypothetical protein